MRGDNGGKGGRSCQGTCTKDTWKKPNGGRIEGGRWGWMGWRGVVGGKYLKRGRKKTSSKNTHTQNLFAAYLSTTYQLE